MLAINRKGRRADGSTYLMREEDRLLQGADFNGDMCADVVVFDPATVIDKATYTDPHHLSVGIRDVFVNGTAVLRDSEHTGKFPGKRVTGPGYRPDIGA